MVSFHSTNEHIPAQGSLIGDKEMKAFSKLLNARREG